MDFVSIFVIVMMLDTIRVFWVFILVHMHGSPAVVMHLKDQVLHPHPFKGKLSNCVCIVLVIYKSTIIFSIMYLIKSP